MIKLHYNGEFYLNEKLISSVDTLKDGTKVFIIMANGNEFYCNETLDEILRLIEEKERNK